MASNDHHLTISFLQHIYTSSWELGGFGTYRKSTDLSEELIEKITPLIKYYRPEGLEADPEKYTEKGNRYPLVFFHTKVQHDSKFYTVLGRTKYVGKDRHSRQARMGNFFAHSLIQRGDTAFPIWALMQYDGWQETIADEGEKDVRQPLEILDFEPNHYPLNSCLKNLQIFLQEQPERKQKLYQLTDAIIDGQKILLREPHPDLWHWIQLITVLFPDSLVRTLSFSTYQPTPTAFDIVGLTLDNEVDNEPFKSFLTITGTPETKYAYTKYIVDEVLMKANNTLWTDLFKELPDTIQHISEGLDTWFSEYQTTNKVKLGDMSIEHTINYIHHNPNAKQSIYESLKSTNSTVYYDVRTKELEDQDFDFKLFQDIFQELSFRQKNELLSYYIDSIEKTNREHETAFYLFLNENIAQIEKQTILKLITAFVTHYYEVESVQKEDIYDAVKQLNPDEFIRIEKNNENWLSQNALKNVLEELIASERVDFQRLWDLIEEYKDFNSVKNFTILMNREPKYLCSIQLNLNQWKLIDILNQQSAILNLCVEIRITGVLPQLDLFKQAIDIETGKWNLSDDFQMPPKEIMDWFTEDKTNVKRIGKLLSLIYTKGISEPVRYERTHEFLSNDNLSKNQKIIIIDAYLENATKSYYRCFRYIQFSVEFNFCEKIEKWMVKEYLKIHHPKTKEIEGVSNADKERVIKQACTKHGLAMPLNVQKLPVTEPPTHIIYDKKIETFLHDNLKRKNQSVSKTERYFFFLSDMDQLLCAQDKNWTFERWTYLLRLVEQKSIAFQVPINIQDTMQPTLKFFIQTINELHKQYKQTEKEIVEDLLIQYILAILKNFSANSEPLREALMKNHRDEIESKQRGLSTNDISVRRVLNHEQVLTMIKYYIQKNSSFQSLEKFIKDSR